MAEAKHFLYRIQAVRPAMLAEGPTADEEQIISEHFSYLEGLTKTGIVLHAGRTLTTDERTFGIVIFRSDSEEEARAVMDGDPAVKQGVMRAELFPYRIALAGPTPSSSSGLPATRERGLPGA